MADGGTQGTGTPTVTIETRVPAASPPPGAPLDHDQARLEAARKAVELEERPPQETQPPAAPAPAANPEPAAPAPTQAAAPAEGEGAKGGAKPPRISIPKERFDEVLTAAAAARAENDRLRGIIEGLSAAGAARQPEQPAKPPEPEPDLLEQRLGEIDAEIVKLAESYESGDITYKQLKTKENELAREAQGIREERVLALATIAQQRNAKPPEGGDAEQIINDRHGAMLEQTHPYLSLVSDADLEFLSEIAHREAAKAGKPYAPNLTDTLRLHEDIGKLSDRYGPMMRPDVTLPTARTQQQPAASQPMSPAAQARANKLQRKAADPPPITQMGAPAQGRREIAETDVMQMTPLARESMSAAERQRLLGLA